MGRRAGERAFELVVGLTLVAAGVVFGSLLVGAALERPYDWSLVYIVAAMGVALAALALRVFFPALRRPDGRWIGRAGAIVILTLYVGFVVMGRGHGLRFGVLGISWGVLTLVLVAAVLAGYRGRGTGTDG